MKALLIIVGDAAASFLSEKDLTTEYLTYPLQAGTNLLEIINPQNASLDYIQNRHSMSLAASELLAILDGL